MTQIKLAFNSNRIEGSLLTEEQTRYMYETKTIVPTSPYDAARVDDVIETQNHFELFNYMLSVAEQPLTEKMIKVFHRILKSSTSDARLDWFVVGDYKTQANMVGNIETADPKNVSAEMQSLLAKYNAKESITLSDIVDFHYHFECIHPFQDGNGRVGRIIMFKECLRNDIVPFIIEDVKKAFYYRGLSEYSREPGFLTDTCLDAQDNYKMYFEKLRFKQKGIKNKINPTL